MVKIAFNSPFALKDEPKKEAAEALVADKVRAQECPGRRRRREERGGVRGGREETEPPPFSRGRGRRRRPRGSRSCGGRSSVLCPGLREP